jgi:hypothetical protein
MFRARGLDRGDVDFFHLHHCIHRAPGGGAIRVRRRRDQRARGDLPGISPAVFAPTTHAFLATVANDGVPQTVRLRLVFGENHKADRFIGDKHRPAVESHEVAAADRELNDKFLSFGAGWRIGGRGADFPDAAVGESRGIEFGCFACFPVVEPQTGNHLFGHVALSSQAVKTRGKFDSRSDANEERLRRV